MSGFKNDVVFSKNADFSASNNTSPSESNGLATNGQLWVGTTALNVGGTHVNVGQLTSPNNSLTIGYNSPNITAIVNHAIDCNFQAYLNAPQTINAGAFDTVIFNATTSNVASGYDTGTGIFTAPFAGFYSFHTAIWGEMNVTDTQTELLVSYVGSAQTSRIFQIGSGSFSGNTIITSNSWSMPMNAGDTVRIQLFASGTGTYRAYGEALGTAAGSGYSTFSGFRVF